MPQLLKPQQGALNSPTPPPQGAKLFTSPLQYSTYFRLVIDGSRQWGEAVGWQWGGGEAGVFKFSGLTTPLLHPLPQHCSICQSSQNIHHLRQTAAKSKQTI